MKMKLTVSVVLVAALAVAAVFGLSAYRSAFAQSATPAAPSTNGQNQANPVKPGGPGRGFDDANNTYLAQALGITTDQLSTAYQTAYQAALDAAVKAGQITQSQADQLAANNGRMPFGLNGDWMAQSGVDFNALLANALGITTDKLQAARQSAYNAQIDQAVTDGTLTSAQADLMKGEYALKNSQIFQDSILAAYKAAVQQAVTAGTITQAQADAILSNLTSANGHGPFGLPGLPGLGGPGDMSGGRGGHGHGGPQGGPQGAPQGAPPAGGSQAAPSTTPGTIQ